MLLRGLRNYSIVHLHSHELGYSSCRLCKRCDKEMGCCDMTDGVYVFPEGLLHYIACHSVRPPNSSFVTSIVAKQKAMGGDLGKTKLMQFDSGELNIIGRGDEEYLRAHSTLYD